MGMDIGIVIGILDDFRYDTKIPQAVTQRRPETLRCSEIKRHRETQSNLWHESWLEQRRPLLREAWLHP